MSLISNPSSGAMAFLLRFPGTSRDRCGGRHTDRRTLCRLLQSSFCFGLTIVFCCKKLASKHTAIRHRGFTPLGTVQALGVAVLVDPGAPFNCDLFRATCLECPSARRIATRIFLRVSVHLLSFDDLASTQSPA